MSNIYVLRLENGRYYIGKSDDIMKRYQQHLNGNGSAWTRKYKPIGLVKTFTNVSPFEEDKITKEYMSKYGIDKVRGGTYVEIELSEKDTGTLQREIWSAKDLCTNCGHPGHFYNDCRAKTSANEYLSDTWQCTHCDRKFTTAYGCTAHAKSCTRGRPNPSYKKENVCYRCGREGHYAPDCFARTHHKGYTLDSDCESDEESDEESDDTDY